MERSKPEIALAELRAGHAAGVSFGAVLADAGYGISAPFRQALSALGLLWAVGIVRIQKVYAADVNMIVASAPRVGGPAHGSSRIRRRSRLRRCWRRPRGVGSPGGAAPKARCGRSSPPCACGSPMGLRCVCRAGPASICRATRSGWWASIAPRRAQVLPVQPAAGHAAEAAGVSDQGALGVRAGAPAAQGRTRARSFRGPLVARVAPACTADADRLSVPAASALARRHRGKKEKPADHRRIRACRPSGACCLIT